MASITITTTTPQDLRLAPAFGDLFGLNRDATTAEVKTYLITLLRNTVQTYERKMSVVSDFDPT